MAELSQQAQVCGGRDVLLLLLPQMDDIYVLHAYILYIMVTRLGTQEMINNLGNRMCRDLTLLCI